MKLLKNRNFSLMILGQIISLFGNSILRFSISLYILEESGSAAIFATILSISILPTILLSPIGGILADRVSRKHIMLVLDFITSIIILFFSLFALQGDVSILMIATVMILLSIIQACYQPSVQSSVPLLVESDELVTANGLVVQINALSTLLGPILGGILFSFIPFPNLLWIAAMFNILAQTYLRQATPVHLLGKVSSFVTMIVMCSYPIGQSIYGYFFEAFSNQQFFIIFIAGILSILISLQSKRKLKDI